MTELTQGAIITALGWALIHALWQGTALAGGASLVMSRCRSASARYWVGMAALGATLAAPIVTFEWLLQHAGVAISTVSGIDSATPAVHAALVPGGDGLSGTKGAETAAPLLWLVAAWSVGVIAFGLRTAGGFWLLGRMRRRASRAVSDELLRTCRSLQRSFGIVRSVRYRVCTWLDAPAVIGWFFPIVFLPVTALTGLSSSQLRWVIAHELAHIRRWDALFHLLQVVTETLLFYHPAVWWLNRRIRAEREHCCDDLTLSVCSDPTDYARALALMAEWQAAPSLAMAATRGPLAERVARILGVDRPRNGRGLAAGVLSLVLALAAGHSVAQSRSQPPTDRGDIPSAGPQPATSPWLLAQPAQRATKGARKAHRKARHPTLADFPADQQAAFEVHEITQQYLEDLRAEGLRPTGEQLIALRMHGVTPEFVARIRELRMAADEQDLIAFRVHQVTPDLIEQWRRHGLAFDAEEAIGMKVNDVTPAFAADLQQLGVRARPDQVIGLRIHEVTPADIEWAREQGITLNPARLIGMKKQGLLNPATPLA